MRTEPETAFNDLVRRLNDLRTSGSPWSEFDLARLKREAEKLRRSQPAHGYTALAIIACLERRVDEMHRYHQKAITLSSDLIHVVNYATSLLTCGFWEDSIGYAKQVYQYAKTDLAMRTEALDTLICASHLLQREADFLDYAMEWEQLTGKPHELLDSPEEDDEVIKSLLATSADSIKSKSGFARLTEATLHTAKDLTEGL